MLPPVLMVLAHVLVLILNMLRHVVYVGDGVIGLNTSLSCVIPAIDTKLGLNYDRSVYSGILTADVGWLWVNYINSIMVWKKSL